MINNFIFFNLTNHKYFSCSYMVFIIIILKVSIIVHLLGALSFIYPCCWIDFLRNVNNLLSELWFVITTVYDYSFLHQSQYFKKNFVSKSQLFMKGFLGYVLNSTYRSGMSFVQAGCTQLWCFFDSASKAFTHFSSVISQKQKKIKELRVLRNNTFL